MSQVVDFAGVGGAILFSIALGVYLEWLAIRGLMRLMPGRPIAVADAHNSSAQNRGTKAA